MSSCLTVSFSCGIVYSRGNRTPESEKNSDVGISHQTEKEKEYFVDYNTAAAAVRLL